MSSLPSGVRMVPLTEETPIVMIEEVKLVLEMHLVLNIQTIVLTMTQSPCADRHCSNLMSQFLL